VYNVFSGSERGPTIFGTEPWDFYIRNLLLNFNVWFLFAISAGPLLGLDFFSRGQFTSKRFSIRSIVFTTPFYLWLAIFSLQPHKEERFMYPAYPFLCLNAAIAMHVLLCYIGASDSSQIMGKISGRIKLAFVSAFILSAIFAGVLRTVGIVNGYQAPLQVYGPLQRFKSIKSEETVCLGKEWYRFPSSYFLPSGMRAKFVKSAFDGLLPGEFNEAKVGFGFFPGTWLEPPGMNDMNIEDRGKYVGILLAISNIKLTISD
jgi:alpha-1,2-mannosyltransferase